MDSFVSNSELGHAGHAHEVTTKQTEIWHQPAPGSLSGNPPIVWEDTFTNIEASYK